MAFDLSLESIKERKHKDGIFGIVYGLITLFVVGVTISHAPHASKVINDISSCPGNPSGNAMHQLRDAAPDLAPPLGDPSEDFFVEDLIHSLPYAGLMPIPCAIVIGVVWMFLLYKFALPIVYGTLVLAGAILVGVGGMLFIESSNPAPLLLTAVGLLLAVRAHSHEAHGAAARSRVHPCAALLVGPLAAPSVVRARSRSSLRWGKRMSPPENYNFVAQEE